MLPLQEVIEHRLDHILQLVLRLVGVCLGAVHLVAQPLDEVLVCKLAVALADDVGDDPLL